MQPLADKVAAVQEWPVPTDATQLRAFLGLAGCYQRFVRGFSQVAAPLYNLLHDRTPFSWGAAEATAFDELKQQLVQAPTLTPVTGAGGFCVTTTQVNTGASDAGTGATLEQVGADGTVHLVAYHSQRFKPAELRYSTYDWELLGIMHALTTWRHYLMGHRFELLTDHNTLQYLTTKKDVSSQESRWLDTLANYEFDIRAVKGTNNAAADALSRRPEPEVHAATTATIADDVRQALVQGYGQDVQYQAVYARLRTGAVD